MTPSERNALCFFSAVTLLGAGVRFYRASRPDNTPATSAHAALRAQIAAVDSARAARASRGPEGSAGSGGSRAKTRRLPSPSTPLSSIPSSALDLDTAPAESLERLPRIGPALARRIIADRDSLGPFGSLEGFQRVKGVGPAMARTLDPYVTFSGTPRPSPVGARVSARRRSPRGEARASRVPP